MASTKKSKTSTSSTKKKVPHKTSTASSGIEDKLKDLMDIDPDMITTVYGRSGTGKTTFASTGPKPQLMIDVKDKGTASGKSKKLQRGDIKVYEVNEFDEMYDLYDYLVENHEDYKSVVIDHMTSLQELSHEKVKQDEGKEKMSQQMYGFSANQMKEIIQLFKGLSDYGVVPIFLVQDRMESGEGEGEDQLIPEVGPGLMPSVAKTLCAASRIVGHTYLYEKAEKIPGGGMSRKIEYRLRLGPNPFYITKVTQPIDQECPSYITNPKYQDLVDIVSGEYKPKTSKKKPLKKKKKSSV